MSSQGISPELLEFAARCLESRGAVVEPGDGFIDCLLSEEISDFLSVSQELRLGAGGQELAYGLPLLDRLVELATRDTPVVYGSLDSGYLKKEGFDRIVMQSMTFPDAKVKCTGRAEVKRTYMVLAVKYTAVSDERKEGLVRICINESTGAVLPEMLNRWRSFSPDFYAEGKVPPHFPMHMEKIIKTGLVAAGKASKDELDSFLRSMERRLRRDIASTTSYYAALASEMEEGLNRAGLSKEAMEERRAKIAALPGERDQKIRDLVQKYSVRLRLTAKAALRFLVPVVQVSASVRKGKARGQLALIWNPIMQGIEPVACTGCGKSIRTIYFREKQSGLRPVCERCR